MADLGTIGSESIIASESPASPPWSFSGARESVIGYRSQGASPRWSFRCIRAGDEYEVLGGKEIVEGNPAQPSLRLDARGMWRFRWAVAAGSRTLRVNVKQVANLSPRPSMIVKANPAIGIAVDVTGIAAGSNDWVAIGPVTVVASIAGAVWVELWNNCDAQTFQAPCYFDRLVAT